MLIFKTWLACPISTTECHSSQGQNPVLPFFSKEAYPLYPHIMAKVQLHYYFFVIEVGFTSLHLPVYECNSL